MTLWCYFTEKEIKISLSLIALFFCCVILWLIFWGSLIFMGVSWSPATSMIELSPTLINKFLLITNVARTSVLDVAGALDPPLLLKVLLFRDIFLKLLVSEFALIIRLLWQCTFNATHNVVFNASLYMSLLISHNGIFFKTCLSTFILKLLWESIT